MTGSPGALNRNAALASVGAALTIGILNSYAVWKTGSIAMLGSLVDTALDLLASLVTLLGVQVAAQPADRHHRFGHGKAEALAALFQVSLISVAAISFGAATPSLAALSCAASRAASIIARPPLA